MSLIDDGDSRLFGEVFVVLQIIECENDQVKYGRVLEMDQIWTCAQHEQRKGEQGKTSNCQW
jgi:hypothetical protein